MCRGANKGGKPRITNGVDVNPPHKYPFAVYLERDDDDGGAYDFCGGSLISKHSYLFDNVKGVFNKCSLICMQTNVSFPFLSTCMPTATNRKISVKMK